MLKIKRDDEVVVIAGKDKGKRGSVLQVKSDGRLLIKGINLVKKHTKADPNRGIAGGIVDQEAAIQASNVAIFNPETQKADRIGFRVEGEKKVRFYKSTGGIIGA